MKYRLTDDKINAANMEERTPALGRKEPGNSSDRGAGQTGTGREKEGAG